MHDKNAADDKNDDMIRKVSARTESKSSALAGSRNHGLLSVVLGTDLCSLLLAPGPDWETTLKR